MKRSNPEDSAPLEDYVVLFNDLMDVNLYDETTINKFLDNLSIKPEFSNEV